MPVLPMVDNLHKEGEVMNEIKALEKLRNALKDCTNKAGVEPNEFDTYWITASACDNLIDEIEVEIAERYMPLPVDADGVPICVGDVVAAQDEQPFEVRAFQLDALGWFAIERLGSQWNVNQLHHVKSRTLEDVVADAIQYGHNGITGDRIEGKVAEFCAEIRELIGGSE